MNRFKKHIASFITVLSVVGMLMSAVHYHNESLKCLAHSDKAHLSQDYDVCNICLINYQTDYTATISISQHFYAEQTIISIPETATDLLSTCPNTGRAPPQFS